jgi:carboxypeptidase T
VIAALLLLNTLDTSWGGPSSPTPLGEAWVRHDPRAPRVPGVGPAEGRRVGPDGVWVRVVVEPWAIEALRAQREVRGYDPAPSARRAAHPPGYHGPEDVLAVLDALEGEIVRGGRLGAGASVAGRPIEALWLGQPPDSGAPSVRLLSGHHGDEAIAVEVALAVTERLVAGDGVDPAVTALLDRATVWVVPLVNPDGLAAGTRDNGAEVDLNRNYDYGWSAASVRPGPAPFSEPETRAVRALTLLERPMVSVSLHAGAANLGWPWNYTGSDPPDDATLGALAQDYAASCTAPGFWVTQGADWYVTWGDTNDWAYGRHGTLDFTLEVSDDRAPDDVAEVVAWHEDAILALLATRPTAWGTVRDAETGAPVEAAVAADSSDRPVHASAVTGAFHLVAPGAAALVVSAAGYEEASVPVGASPIEVALQPATVGRGRLAPAVLVGPAAVVAADERLDGPVTLLQPGQEPVTVTPQLGALLLDPAALAPGLWTVQTADGRTLPRALLVEHAEGIAVTGHTLEAGGEIARIAVGPQRALARGVRAWAVWGEERTVEPVPVLEEGAGEVALDISRIPRNEGAVDVMVQSGGATLGVEDLFRPRLRGPGSADEVRSTRCGCVGTAADLGGPTGGAASLLLLVVSRRRRLARRVR